MAAKIYEQRERDHFAAVVAPAIEDGVVEFLGEVGSSERDELFAGALATIMLGAWPEPFGLVAIESMATGTPVIGRRAGALPRSSRKVEPASWSTMSKRSSRPGTSCDAGSHRSA